MTRLPLPFARRAAPFAACLLLAACANAPGDATPAAATATPPAASAGAAAPATLGVADQAMSCDQITAEVDRQNAIGKAAGEASAAAQKGTTMSQTDNATQMTEMDKVRQAAADRRGNAATARGNALVALGKQKKCFAG